jgi:hypothetical protein
MPFNYPAGQEAERKFFSENKAVKRFASFENKNPASAMGLQRAVVAHGGHRLNVFYFHWIPQRSLGNEACNTRPELSSQIEGVGSLIFPIDLKQGNFSPFESFRF